MGGRMLLELIREHWLPILIFLISPVGLRSLILLLLTNKHERILFSPQKSLYRLLTKIACLSIVGTLFASILTSTLAFTLKDVSFEPTLGYLIFAFITYFFLMTLILSYYEKKDRVYHWIYLEKYKYEPLLIQKVTFNNKLLLTSVPSQEGKYEQGYIALEDTSILENQKIHYLAPKKTRRFRINRPTQQDLIEVIKNHKV